MSLKSIYEATLFKDQSYYTSTYAGRKSNPFYSPKKKKKAVDDHHKDLPPKDEIMDKIQEGKPLSKVRLAPIRNLSVSHSQPNLDHKIK
jgi:hypothetical protein